MERVRWLEIASCLCETNVVVSECTAHVTVQSVIKFYIIIFYILFLGCFKY